MSARWSQVQELRRSAPKSLLLRGTTVGFLALVLWAWFLGPISAGEIFTERRLTNLERFLTVEAVPYPLREDGAGASEFFAWVSGIWNDRGREATFATLWIAVAAISLAGLIGLLVAPLAARTLATGDPYLQPRDSLPWRVTRGATRTGCVFARALPEYVLAFLFLQLLPYGAWPAVLAIALHNGGILGRLYGDTLENLPASPLRSLRMLGAERGAIVAIAALPMALPRLLLYYFYRFETCVREATVLGMLGIASLGSEVAEARAAFFYDELLLLVAFGIGIVLAGDLASYMARAAVRRAR